MSTSVRGPLDQSASDLDLLSNFCLVLYWFHEPRSSSCLVVQPSVFSSFLPKAPAGTGRLHAHNSRRWDCEGDEGEVLLCCIKLWRWAEPGEFVLQRSAVHHAGWPDCYHGHRKIQVMMYQWPTFGEGSFWTRATKETDQVACIATSNLELMVELEDQTKLFMPVTAFSTILWFCGTSWMKHPIQ